MNRGRSINVSIQDDSNQAETWEDGMDPIASLIVPALVGGAVMAMCLAFVHRRARRDETPAVAISEPIGTDMINMAHIRVAGVGGLGFVILALWIGIVTPGVRGPLAIGAALGAVMAVALILWRRRTGPMTSSGQRPGANTTLSIEPIEPHAESSDDDRARVQRLKLVGASH
jgi:peptidoglycan/LPS O-acetylase OafA/YrhL